MIDIIYKWLIDIFASYLMIMIMFNRDDDITFSMAILYAYVSRRVLQTYAGAVESILTGSITAWLSNSSSQDRRALQRVVRSAEHTIGTTLPTLQDLYSRRCWTRACTFMKDPHHPNNKLFQLLWSGKRLCSHAARTERLKQSFFQDCLLVYMAFAVYLALLIFLIFAHISLYKKSCSFAVKTVNSVDRAAAVLIFSLPHKFAKPFKPPR